MAGSGTAHLRQPSETLLRIQNLVVDFPAGRGKKVSAVSNVSFDIASGETLGLVGESGCGKSTTGKAIMQLPRPTRGEVTLDGTDLCSLRGEQLRNTRPRLQMIFQDPISSLNPRRTVMQIVEEPLNIWKIGTPEERRLKVNEVLSAVGIDPEAAAERKRIVLEELGLEQRRLESVLSQVATVSMRTDSDAERQKFLASAKKKESLHRSNIELLEKEASRFR